VLHDAPLPRNAFLRSIAAAALTIASFFYASAIFLCAQKQLGHLPPTDPVAIGRVTIERASKFHDYASFILFIAIVSIGTVALRVVAEKLLRRYAPPAADDGVRTRVALLFAAPFTLAPFLWLTTAKEGWALLLPPALAMVSLFLLRPVSRRFFGILRQPQVAPFTSLLVAEVASWILFRYLATGKRIAHIPTLFLELIFLAFFLALGVVAALLAARLVALTFGHELERSVATVVTSLWPLLLLAPFGVALLPTSAAFITVAVLIALTLFFLRGRNALVLAPRLQSATRWLVIPALLFLFSYASTASPSSWIDLFHRGETLGPASDYLRGKVPYRDVFVLHGMLEDGMLDSWLMQCFGRDAHVALARITLTGAATFAILYLLTLTIFDSVAFALAGVALGLFTFVDNQRVVFHLLPVLLFVLAVRRRPSWAIAAGAASALALFYSIDIGVYSLFGAALSLLILSFSRAARGLVRPGRIALYFIVGVIAGALPFVVYLGAVGALPSFLNTSFVQVPAVIDAVWSLPFPDLGATFRSDLSLRTISDFILGEKIRFVLNPLILAALAAFVIARATKQQIDWWWMVAVVLLCNALLSQRSALGRADFQHQYFAAYLLAPILLLLANDALQRIKSWRSEATATPFVALLGVSIALCSLAFLWVPDLLNTRIDSVIGYRPRVVAETYADPQADAVAMRVLSVRAAVAERVRPQEAIFDFSNQPALYFFADRKNATRFYQVPVASPLKYENEIVQALAASRPKVILRGSPEGFDRFDAISNDIRAPHVARYIDRNYAFEKQVRGIELWTLRSNLPQPFVATSLVVPKKVAAESSDRLIFPSLGSLRGASDSFWKSDLVLTNPYDEATTLRLRYLGTTGNSDRTLTLRAGQTTVLSDVAAAFFARPGSRGACIIRFSDGRRPVAILNSYDSAHAGSSSTEQPLDLSAGAVGGTRRDHLVISGISDSAVRRVNLGLVNIGDTPLQFELYARGADGARLGRPINGSLAEGDSYLLVSASRELGVEIDASMSIVARVKGGTAVGYASVIDGATGSHFSLPLTAVSMP
jgi:hypothetical protein